MKGLDDRAYQARIAELHRERFLKKYLVKRCVACRAEFPQPRRRGRPFTRCDTCRVAA